MGSDPKDWADQFAEIVDKAVDSAKQAWDGTEESRVSLMESVKRAANDVASYAVEATEATKAAWHREDAPESEAADEAPTDPPTSAVADDDGAAEESATAD